MMDEASDSKNGLSRILSRHRRHRKEMGSSSNSIVSTETMNSDGHHRVRDAIEGAVEKLKSSPTDEPGDANGLKKLVHKGMGSHRRRTRREREEDDERARRAASRGRNVAERGTLENQSSNDSDGLAVITGWSGDGSGSSLVTYDSEPDSSFDTRSPPSTHPSHLELLTSSSPLIHSTSLPTESATEARFDDATPLSSSVLISADKLATSEPTPSVTSSLRAPTEGSHRRSPSPVGRLKGAFRPHRKASSQHSSPERKAGGAAAEPPPPGKNKDAFGVQRDTTASTASPIVHSPASTSSLPPKTTSEPAQAPHVQRIDTISLPQTPPRTDSAPLIVNTPPTPTDSSVPYFPSASDRGTPNSVTSNPNVITSPSGNMISHRRVRSTSTSLGPSKLSSIASAPPLTPTSEERSTTPSNSNGFFNSVFSVAQNAANSFTTSITNTNFVPGGRHRSGTLDIKEVDSPQVETLQETLGETSDGGDQAEEKEPAVKTLGMGDLNLSHLGIIENNSGADTPMAPTHPDGTRGRNETMATDPLSNNSATAQSSALVEAGDPSTASQVEDLQTSGRPRSIQEPSRFEVETPPNGSVYEDRTGIYHSGSIRSRRHRRTRGSSATNGTSIGAAIAAANASLAHPNANGSTPKITGFAVASKKRNRDFHQLFRSVPDDDYLIEDYSCALQREILAHGRLYVSEGHLCFSSNIFGWVTTLVMSFDEIVSVEKRSTALLFKNGLVISTLHAKNVFASFTSRDSTYDLIVGIWKLGHPSLRSSLNGVRIDETGGGDKTEKVDGNGAASISGSDSESEEDEGDEIYDEDEDEHDSMSFSHAEASVAGSDVGEKLASRKASNTVTPTNSITAEKKVDGSAAPGGDFPGPTTHAATDCADGDSHYSKIIADEVVPAPLGKVYSLMFGPSSVTWLKNWLTVDQKCLELTMDDKKHLSLDNKVRVYSYIKPLNGSFGPKQTKCISTETLDSLDLEKAVSVTISTQTPDVPSGNVFSTKTKYCLTWADGNSTRIQMNCAIEWTGKSWLKAPIEKGANDGQVQYASDIVAALKKAVSRRPAAAAISGKKGKRSRKVRGLKSTSQVAEASDTKAKAENWGIFEPLRPVFGPVVGIVNSLATGNLMYGLLVGLLVASWFRFGTSGIGKGGDVGWEGTADRIAAYEEIWRREETELWDWLEQRAGMDTIRDAARMQSEAHMISDKMKDEKMQNREMDDAIRVTEEKLRLFKAVVEKEKAKKEKAKKVGKKEEPKSVAESEQTAEQKL